MADLTEGPYSRALAVPGLLGAMVSFQIGASIAKSLFPAFGAVGMVGLRISLSTLVLAVVWRALPRQSGRRRPGAADLRVIVPYGLAIGLMNLLFYLSLVRLPLGAAVAIEFTGPLALALIGSRRRLDLLWALLVVCGLAMLLDPATALHRLDPLGVAFALGAGLFVALYIVFGQRVGQRIGGNDATTFGMAVACLAVVPFCLPAMLPAATRPWQLFEAGLVAILSGALPYSLEMAAMRRIGARSFGILMSLDPALAALAGLVLLGERLPPLRWLGILCVVLASAGTALTTEVGSRREPARRPETIDA